MTTLPAGAAGSKSRFAARPGRRSDAQPETYRAIHPLREVALPTEHGGWSLSTEPAILGLLIVASKAGFLLGLIGLLAFITRTPLKLALVDRWRGRSLPRTRLAQRVAAVELLVLAALTGGVVAVAEHDRWWLPILIAAPLLGLELWYDMHSRGRRLVPILAGPIGLGSLAASVILVGGGSTTVAIGAWVAIALRSVAAIFFVRSQIQRIRKQKNRSVPASEPVAIQMGLGLLALVAWLVGYLPGSVAILLGSVIGIHLVLRQLPVPALKVVGFQQLGLGIIFIITAGLLF